MLKAFHNAFKIEELRERILFTALLLAIYRLGAHITLPGINDAALKAFFDSLGGRFGENVIGFVNLFSGGAFEQMTIFALGIQPYISASIAMQLLTMVIPQLKELSKDGNGRRKITQYTRYATVLLGGVQAIGISAILRNPSSLGYDRPIVANPTIGWTILVMLTLMAGTMFVMWLGEQITKLGIGQGISIIITAGIVSRLPSGTATLLSRMLSGDVSIPKVAIFLGLVLIAIMGTVYISSSERRMPVQYGGRRVVAGQPTHIPLRVNSAGMIPIIFAVTMMQFPSTMLGFMPQTWKWVAGVQALFAPTSPVYLAMYAALIVGFTYFYAAVQIDPVQMAENLKNSHGTILSHGSTKKLRPGSETAEEINYILTRITLVGGIFLALIAIIPMVFEGWLKIGTMVSGASVLIVVGVMLDTYNAIKGYSTEKKAQRGFRRNIRSTGRSKRFTE